MKSYSDESSAGEQWQYRKFKRNEKKLFRKTKFQIFFSFFFMPVLKSTKHERMPDTGKFDSKLKKKIFYIYIFVLIHTPLLSPCLMIEINDICIKIQFLIEEGKNTQFWYNYREYDQ